MKLEFGKENATALIGMGLTVGGFVLNMVSNKVERKQLDFTITRKVAEEVGKIDFVKIFEEMRAVEEIVGDTVENIVDINK